jgi:large subunit ribosomal protein L10
MPLTKTQKEELVGRYAGGLATAPHAFLISYQGIKVNDVTELRARVRAAGGSYEVVKNTLALLAIEGKPLGALKDTFTGALAVVYTEGDPVAVAKALTEFAKTVPAVVFRGGMVDGKPIAANEVEQIAKLPSREELIAKLLFLLQSPVSRFVRTLGAVTREFVVVMDQIGKQKAGASTST